MARFSRNGVLDWQELERMMPFASDERSKRQRIALFKEMDADDNGLLHISEAVRAFFRRIPSVRGIIDMRHVWTHCFHLARHTVQPVAPIGIDFMEQHQFRVYILCLWIYLSLWECFWRPGFQGIVFVTRGDIRRVIEVLTRFGHDDDAYGLESWLHSYFENEGTEKIHFEKFVDTCLKEIMPELSKLEEEYERSNAIAQLKRIQPGLLHKDDQVGKHKVHSLETLQPRMTGFAVRKVLSAATDQAAPPAASQGNRQQQWNSQYAMMYTATKFQPESRLNPCTARQLSTTSSPNKSNSAVELRSLSTVGNRIVGSTQAKFPPYQPFRETVRGNDYVFARAR